MLKNIALIASGISALTAVTTSLRALGKSRENLRYETESSLKTGCRIGSGKTVQPATKQNSLLIHFIVTVIWLVLSIIFAFSSLDQIWENGLDIRMFLWVSPFIVLVITLLLIWRKVLYPGR